MFRLFPILLFVSLLSYCQSSLPVEKTSPLDDDKDILWIDGDTLHISSFGLIPSPRKDPATSKLVSCQDAREKAIARFHERFLPNTNKNRYSGRKYSDDFHRYHMEISTISKSNDDKGNCRMIMQFKGKGLRDKLTEK